MSSKLRQKMHVAATLEVVLSMDGDGCVAYREGWSDSRVAEECRTTTQTVVAVRRELYGDKFKRPKSNGGLVARIERIEQRLNAMEQRIEIINNHLHLQVQTERTLPNVPRWDLNSDP